MVMRDGDNGRGQGSSSQRWEKKAALRELRDGVVRRDWLGGRAGESRKTDRCRKERKIWFTFLISFYQALGESGTTKSEMERRAARAGGRQSNKVCLRALPPCSAGIKAAGSLHYSAAIFVTRQPFVSV